MNRYHFIKHTFVAFLIIAAAIYALPSLYEKSPSVQIRSLTTGSQDTLTNKVMGALQESQIDFTKITWSDDLLHIVFDDVEAQIAARTLLNKQLNQDKNSYVVALNTISNTPEWFHSIGANPIALGLDLRGGVYFLLQIDLTIPENRKLDGIVDDVRSEVTKMGGQIELDNQSLLITADSQLDVDAIVDYILETYPNIETNEESTTPARLLLTEAAKEEISRLTMEQNLQTLRNRVNELGVAEPVITQQGQDQIVVQLPGIQDTAQARDILGRTAALELRGVNESKTNSKSVLRRAINGHVPANTELFYTNDEQPLLLNKRVEVEGKNITDARPGYDNNNQAAVFISLDGSGANNMKRYTRKNVGNRLAIVLHDKEQSEIISAPSIREELFANFMISGQMNTAEAANLALLLRAGALAAPLEIIEERTVGPSLGAENIANGLNSVLGGFIAIAFFIIFYYAAFGVISVGALCVNIVILTALLGLAGATLTLPGLAGFALTLGMAIDANVLINERIREEYDAGASPFTAIKNGYGRAYTTILDANVTTFIAGLALFVFGSGPIRGFAVVLCLGLLTSMFSAVQVSRSFVNLAVERGNKPKKLFLGFRLLNLKRVLPLMKYRKKTGILSAFFVLVCVGSLITQGLNFGIDFTGGTIVETTFSQAPKANAVRQAINKAQLEEAQIQVSDDGIVLITAPPSKDGSDLSLIILTALRTIDSSANIRRIEYVGPQVGDDLFIKGALALVFVLLGITLYLSFRFRWRMAIGAIVANFHDVIFILGLFSMFQWSFTLPVLAAILAVLGYSVNESVVIFDRVRENFRQQRKAEGQAASTLDSAISQTWARTIITHGSTQLAVMAMLFFGGDALYLFALALTIGIFSSIYSSVLVAGPVALYFGLTRDDFIEETEATLVDNPHGAAV